VAAAFPKVPPASIPILEAECLRVINTVGLDPHVGFLHEMNPSENSLAYDLQESFRFLVDLEVINLVENATMDKKDFIVTENYNQIYDRFFAKMRCVFARLLLPHNKFDGYIQC
jgi:CRISPR/Cas system-associated endonuclease Cas1